MKIDFIWTIYTEKKHTEQRATALAGRVSKQVGIPLLPQTPVGAAGNKLEALVLEINALSDEVTIGDTSYDYCALISKIQNTLQSLGVVNPEIYIDGHDPLQYAMLQEKTARRLEATLHEVIRRLLPRRKWFKNQFLAEIRHYLEAAIKK